MLNVNIVSLKGDLDYFRKRFSIADDLARLERFGYGATVILDLKDVEYADSAFAHALIRLHQRMLVQQPETYICLAAPRPIVWRLFEVLEVDRMFPTFADISTAYRYQWHRHHVLGFQNPSAPGDDLDYGATLMNGRL